MSSRELYRLLPMYSMKKSQFETKGEVRPLVVRRVTCLPTVAAGDKIPLTALTAWNDLASQRHPAVTHEITS